ncbi:MAG TPA: TolC family protein [Burkholderiales bacterium]|nr:TolC family protein [Burkholderiales bacterium]
MAAAIVALAGCSSLEPHALAPRDVLATARADKARAAADVEPLQGPLTLEEAIARTIKYNAERRLKAMEEAVAAGTFEAGKFDMLPKLVASAGYRYRDKELITRSEDSVTGAPALANPFISTDRTAITTGLEFTWSLLDFGQSYYAARQNADRVLVAAERRRRAVNTLIQDVRTAYWRVVAADKLGEEVRRVVAEAEGALADARKAENERLRPPLEPLRYQRQLLENLRLLELVRQELSTARVELAALTNLPLAQRIEVVAPDTSIGTAWLEVPVEQMEEHALMLNPELRESMYNARIAREETRRVLLRLFPGLSFNYGGKTSDDRFLINDHWREAGIQTSFNLLNLVAAPAQMRLADAGVALADQKRLAAQMAVLAQLHIARLQFSNAVRQYERANVIAGVDARIAEQVANQEQAARQTKLERVSQDTASILSSLRRYQALSNAQAAASRLQATLGLEPAVNGSDALPLKQLTAAVARSMNDWKSGRLPIVPASTKPAQR